MGKHYRVFLFYPNVIGYIRFTLLVTAIWLQLKDNIWLFFVCYVTSAILDCVDGSVARAFNQVSEFGAFLDIVIDNFSRTYLWSLIHPVCSLVASFEWVIFVSTHNIGGRWKDTASTRESPKFVQRVMANEFRSPLGFLVIAGIHVLPIWIYFQQIFLLPTYIWFTGVIVLITGRILGFLVECWYLWKHIEILITEKGNH